MNAARLPGIFVTGTDTGVGKTCVASALARAMALGGRRVGVLKPLATGATRSGGTWQCDDAARLMDAAGVAGVVPLSKVAPIIYEEPLAPCVAARRAGTPLTRQHVERSVADAIGWWDEVYGADVLVVEGVGGLLCPLAEGTTVADLAVKLDYPLLVVARKALGTLNHTLLTVEAASIRALRVMGIVLNSPEPGADSPAEATAADELSRRMPGIPILAEVSHAGNVALPESMVCVDWYERSRRSRALGPG